MSDPNESELSQDSNPAPPKAQTEPAIEIDSGGNAGGGEAGIGGPISLARIRELRKIQEEQAREQARSKPKPASHTPKRESESGSEDADSDASTAEKTNLRGKGGKGKDRSRAETGRIQTPPQVAPKVAVPSRRQPLPDDLENELNAAMGGGTDLDKLLIGDSMLQIGHQLDEGQRIQATVMKTHGDSVFVSLGGPNEGVIPKLQFETLPEPGDRFDVIVRGYLPQESLYELTKPGNAVEVADWSDLREGEIIEVVVTGSNAGGLECKAGHIPGFIPISQITEYRIENTADFVGQKMMCVVTEANPRRGNLVLSRRAVLEREKAEKREARLAGLEIGAAVDGVVRKVLDFGAFIDIGGIDGLLHISQLSWERVKHPSELLSEGQKIQVRIDKIDPQTGKIGLSYRSLQDHPWTGIEQRFPVGAMVQGTVSRIAEFGAFVKLATGIEGLIHLSELAHHRVTRVGNVVQEGQEVSVKVLSIEPEKQRMSLSLKAAQTAPETENAGQEEAEEPARKPVVPKHRGPLKGGTGKSSGGEQFGLKW